MAAIISKKSSKPREPVCESWTRQRTEAGRRKPLVRFLLTESTEPIVARYCHRAFLSFRIHALEKRDTATVTLYHFRGTKTPKFLLSLFRETEELCPSVTSKQSMLHHRIASLARLCAYAALGIDRFRSALSGSIQRVLLGVRVGSLGVIESNFHSDDCPI